MNTPLTEGAAIVYRDNAGRRRADYVENGRAGYDLVGGIGCTFLNRRWTPLRRIRTMGSADIARGVCSRFDPPWFEVSDE